MTMISGRKGSSGKGGGGSSGGSEAANTLQSDTIAHVIELLGEGEIVGLVDINGNPVEDSGYVGLDSGVGPFNLSTGEGGYAVSGTGGSAIFFDQTQAEGNDGSAIFHGLQWEQRRGLPDQPYLGGTNQTATPNSVETQVKVATGPVVRTITDPNIDTVLVVTRLPALASTDNDGNINGTDVAYHFDVRPSGGAWVTVAALSLSGQKCTSPWNKAHTFTLPAGGAPWDIRMVRDTADSASLKLQNDTYWQSYTEITQGKFIYPDSALVSLIIDASQFGSSLPARSFRVKGLKTDVPSNYDPATRTYTGIWDGTFKKAWHNNPAWVFWDLLTNSRYGLGEFVDPGIIDRFGLYTIGQYCDESVPSGFSDTGGNPIFEPRFTFNGVINSRKEAYQVLQDVAAAFRGMAYWSLGQVFAAADMPADPITTISPANVIDGQFKYSGTAMKARHSVALITWYDPNDFFRPAIEVVQNDPMLVRYGWREIAINAIGCTSRGQAHRYGKWILDTEQHETETVEFTLSWDGYVRDGGYTLKPGDIILIADPRKAGSVRNGGRIVAATTAQVTIDAPFTPVGGNTYSLNVILTDGSLKTVPITQFVNGNTTLDLGGALPSAPAPGAMWSISGTDVNPRRYRIMSVQESAQNEFKLTALFSDPTKYARVEQDIQLQPVAYSRPKNTVLPPTNVTGSESRFVQDGVYHSRVSLSWTAPADFNVANYHITGQGPYGYDDFGTTIVPGVNLDDLAQGNWVFSIYALNRVGLQSPPAVFNMNVQGWNSLTAPTVIDLVLVNAEPGNVFNTPAPTLTWTNEFPANQPAYAADNIVRVYDADTSALVRTDRIRGQSYTYTFEDNRNDGGPRRHLRFDVTVVTAVETESAATSITITNPQPAAIIPTINTDTAGFADVSFITGAADYSGAMVWVSQDPAFTPIINIDYSGFGNTVYDGPNTKVTVGCPNAGTYYIWIALYDIFGKAGANISARQTVTVTSVDQAVQAAAQDVANTAAQSVLVDVEDLAESVAAFMAEYLTLKDEHSNYLQLSRQALSIATDTVNAAVVSEQIARTTSDGVIAQSVTQVATTVGQNTASISTIQESVNGVSVKFGVTGTINGVTGGFQFTGIQKLDGSVAFAVEIDGNLVVNGSITGTKIAANAITATHISAGAIDAASMLADNLIVTGKIVNNAITQMWSASGGSLGLTPGTIISLSFTPSVGNVLVQAECDSDCSRTTQGRPSSMFASIYLDGVLVAQRTLGWATYSSDPNTPSGSGSMYFCCIGSVHVQAQLDVTANVSHTVSFIISNVPTTSVAGGGLTGGNIVVQELKR